MKRLLGLAAYLFDYYILHAGDKIEYLRAQGAKIGHGCDLIAKIDNFGSEPYLLRIGNNVTVAQGVILLTHDGATRTFRHNEPRWGPGMGLYGTIEIGDNVFLGINSIVLPGVKIGHESIVGAGSVVTKDVPPGVVVAGNPARAISTLDNYRNHALAQAVNVNISSKATKCADLVARFWPESSKLPH